MGIEDPDADVVEQHQPVTPGDQDEEPTYDPEGFPPEADPADVAEQREVVTEDDDYDRD